MQLSLEALIAQLKTARYGDRDLDLEMYKILGLCVQDVWRCGEGISWRDGDMIGYAHLPSYTTSFDAIYNIFPSNVSINMGITLKCNNGKRHKDSVMVWTHDDKNNQVSRFCPPIINAATPALVLCIALLEFKLFERDK
tara:strand:- start:124 stop:540 length:417 start_codon:yes stop_codon:yes gene_type:complete